MGSCCSRRQVSGWRHLSKNCSNLLAHADRALRCYILSVFGFRCTIICCAAEVVVRA